MVPMYVCIKYINIRVAVSNSLIVHHVCGHVDKETFRNRELQEQNLDSVCSSQAANRTELKA